MVVVLFDSQVYRYAFRRSVHLLSAGKAQGGTRRRAPLPQVVHAELPWVDDRYLTHSEPR